MIHGDTSKQGKIAQMLAGTEEAAFPLTVADVEAVFSALGVAPPPDSQ